VNRRSLRGCLDRRQCQVLEHAWVQSAADGFPLNAMITIRPFGELSALDHSVLVEKLWNGLGVWSRRRGEYRCILIREAAHNGKQHGINEHCHVLRPRSQAGQLALQPGGHPTRPLPRRKYKIHCKINYLFG
jgi:hypothetical protein